jgi:hypothetical protein
MPVRLECCNYRPFVRFETSDGSHMQASEKVAMTHTYHRDSHTGEPHGIVADVATGAGRAACGFVLGVALAASGCFAAPASDLEAYEDSAGQVTASGVRYEAENRSGSKGCANAANYGGFSGSGFVDFGGNGSYIEWNKVSAAAAGEYTLKVRYANAGAGPRPAAITVNGADAGAIDFASTTQWSNWAVATLKVNLRAGSNTIRVTANTNSGGPNVDYLEVAPVASTRYEAENRTASSDCTSASNYSGFSGSGFVDLGGNGSYIEWNNIRAAAAGTQTLTLRHANGSANARTMVVTVNGASAGTVAFNSTVDWSAWALVSLKVNLRAGSNTVRLTANTDTGGPNVDYADVTGESGTSVDTGGEPVNNGGTGIALPIEVLGPAGTTQTVDVQVDDPSNVTHLYVRCNACGYHDSDLDANPSMVKATVSINGGSAIALKRYTGGGRNVGNTSIEIIGAEGDYGGIGGAFRTVRMRVPVTGLTRGKNTITFAHKTPAPPSIGFRIIELNLQRNGQNILPASTFAHDDPATWRAPLSGASDIEQGRTLWSARHRLTDPGLDAINGNADGKISASCSDCHASDGRDLKYFNFSNRSIIERSVFHGLARTDGERIASYIRSRSLPHVPQARPWNPAYQPGPGLDAKDAYFWAAGAGLDAILDKDASVKDELFPNDTSVSLDDVRRVGSRLGKLNLRELRVALPMPEWNQWLPHVHPDDAFNTAASAILQDENGKTVSQPYYLDLYEAAQAAPTPENIGGMTTKVKTWLRRGMTCDTNGPGNGEPWRGLNGGVLNAITLPKKAFTSCLPKEQRSRADEQAYEIAKRGLSAWIAVKQWEIVHGNDLEDEGKKTQSANVPDRGRLSSDRVCSSQCVDARERGWFVSGRNVFDRPPHFVSHNSRQFYGQDIVTGVAETNAWYHLNMILDPGYRIMMPSHFAYVCSHIEILQAESGIDQGFRFWASMIKQRQLQTNGFYGAETGNDLRTSQPHVYYGANRGGTSEAQASVGQPMWRYFAQAMVEDFVEDSNRATAGDWASATGNSEVQARSSVDFSPGDRFETDAFQGRNTYRVIPKLLQIGVDRGTVIALKDWGKKTWPNGPWDSLVQ